MNVSELARKLKMPTKELLVLLPQLGFDIGARAIKVDERLAARIVKQWPSLMRQLRETQQAAAVEAAMPTAGQPRRVEVPPTITVKDFAVRASIPITKVLAELLKNGVLSSMNERIDYDPAAVIGADQRLEVVPAAAGAAAAAVASGPVHSRAAVAGATSRPPVVVVLGHVDHGKTTLLDTIRSANIAGGESGGITQHIGAYTITKAGRAITFVDTPGHELFTTMRSRGARLADVAILVVAVDDGVQPQTIESIKIIKSAGLPMVVALNKMDKPGANPDKVKQELAQLNLTPEDWGGSTVCVPVSARQNTGIDKLLEMVLLVADLEKDQITANPNAPAEGTIIEAHVDQGVGPVATVLVRQGSLRVGDAVLIAGQYFGKIRSLKDFRGGTLTVAGPSTPATIIGLKAAPAVGEPLTVTASVDRASKRNTRTLRAQSTAVYVATLHREHGTQTPALNIVVKADMLGSLEAILAALDKIEHPDVKLVVAGKGLGNVTESDVMTAASSQALVLGLHVVAPPPVAVLARDSHVEVKTFTIIYELIDTVRARLEALLKPRVVRTDYGTLKVLALFHGDKAGQVVGGAVTKGKVVLPSKIEVTREGAIIATGSLGQLQLNKITVNEVLAPAQCGIKFVGKPVIAVGDILTCYREESKVQRLA